MDLDSEIAGSSAANADLRSYSGGPAETQSTKGMSTFRKEGPGAAEPQSATHGGTGESSGTWLPLNSRRLMKNQLQLIADTFGLPVNLSKDEFFFLFL